MSNNPVAYVSGSSLAEKIVVAFYVIICANIVLMFTLARDIVLNYFIASDEGSIFDLMVLADVCVLILTTLVLIVLFLVWVLRSHKNLKTFGAQGLRFTPGWAVGWWFVPFYNLIRPFEVMKEIYCASEPGEDGRSWIGKEPPKYFQYWWICFILSKIVSRISGRLERKVETDVDWIAIWNLDLIAAGLSLVAAVYAIRMVKEIDSRQSGAFDATRAAQIPAMNQYADNI